MTIRPTTNTRMPHTATGSALAESPASRAPRDGSRSSSRCSAPTTTPATSPHQRPLTVSMFGSSVPGPAAHPDGGDRGDPERHPAAHRQGGHGRGDRQRDRAGHDERGPGVGPAGGYPAGRGDRRDDAGHGARHRLGELGPPVPAQHLRDEGEHHRARQHRRQVAQHRLALREVGNGRAADAAERHDHPRAPRRGQPQQRRPAQRDENHQDHDRRHEGQRLGLDVGRSGDDGCEHSGQHGAGGYGHAPEFPRDRPGSFNRSTARARSPPDPAPERDERHSLHATVTGADQHGGA